MGEITLYRFGEYELDAQLWELRRHGEPLPLRGKPLSLLFYLVKHADRVVSHEELLHAVWPGIHVEEAVLKTAVQVVRRVLQDPARAPRWVASARGRGYRFHGAFEAGARAIPEPARATSLARAGEFVGRDGMLEQLRAALGGERRVLLLHGPAGIGKTRLAQELGREALASGFEVHVGRTYDGEGAPPFWPWVEILRSWFDARSPDARAKVALECPALAVLLPERVSAYGVRRESGAQPGEPQRARFQMFDEIANLLRIASQQRPLLLVLDDLHWADEDSLALLLFLARHTPGVRGLILGTHRDAAEESARSRQLAAVLSEDGSESLALRGLELAPVEQLLRGRLGEARAGELAARIHATTGGNPLFVLELAKSLDSATGAALPALERIPIPERLRSVVAASVRACSPECQRALHALCVEPGALGAAVLGRALQLEGPALFAVLGEAISTGHAVCSADTYRFAHAVVRETLYDGLAPAARVAWHRAIGEAIEAVGGADTAMGLGQVAHHFAESAALAQPQRAIAYAQRAAQAACAVFAYGEAAALYRRALRALEFAAVPDEELRCSLLISLGDMLGRVGEPFDVMQDAFLQALERAREHGLVRLWASASERCAVHLNIRGAFTPALYSGSDAMSQRLRRELEAVLPALGEPADAPLRARVRMALYVLEAFAGERRVAQAQLREAEKIVETQSDAALRAELLTCVWDSGLRFELSEERHALPAEVLRHARPAGRIDLEVYARSMEIHLALERGDREGAERISQSFTRLADRSLDARWALWMWRLLDVALDGDLARVERETQTMQRLAAQDHWPRPVIESVRSTHAWWMLLLGGGIEPVLDNLRRRSASQAFRPVVRLLLARLCAHCGLLDEARAELDGLERKLEVLALGEDWLFFAALAAEICALVRDSEQAGWMFAALAPYTERVAVVGGVLCTGSVARPLGSLAALLGRFDDAEELFAAAAAQAKKLRSPVLASLTELDHAAALVERGRAADLSRGAPLIRSAALAAERHSWGGLLERARALAARVP